MKDVTKNYIFSLSDTRPGQWVGLSHILAENKTKKRLLSMGLNIGTSCRVLRNLSGSVLVAHASNRLAISKDIARQIMVSQI